ncbi:hypothetical protein Cgig2_000342 [Carnegiea gigantea]|uniref:Uncharacterized protein n=1 Tax=Carnegiea gigantea TaxID=171969 RepID=A0A9Q1JIF1_9CARY|nr:hypothetical protein Cgig2_000342 [Carnegiea gigantea]
MVKALSDRSSFLTTFPGEARSSKKRELRTKYVKRLDSSISLIKHQNKAHWVSYGNLPLMLPLAMALKAIGSMVLIRLLRLSLITITLFLLCAMPSEKEIKDAVFSIPSMKSPGPTYATPEESYNIFGDGVGGVDPKEVNGAKLLMYYNITSPKDKALYQPNHKKSI